MKKAAAWILGVFCAMAFTACVPAASGSSKAAQSGSAGSAAAPLPASGARQQIANPFQDCDSMDAAAAVAGFEMTVPDQIDGYPDRTIQAIENELIQVSYRGEDDGVLLRKAAGTDDVSGDYNVYAETDTAAVGELTVTLKGNDGTVSVASWTDGGYAYAIDIDGTGLSRDAVIALVAEVG